MQEMPGGNLGRLQILSQCGVMQKKDTIPNSTIKGAILGGDIMSIKIGAAYIRVSSDDQLEYSPDSQLKVIRDYAKREDYIIPDEYIYKDDGISGKSASKRPAFRLMIATAKEDSPPFDSIFVWKYSRFARNQEEAIMYKNLLKKRGVTVKSISEPSSDSPFASLIERIVEWMDEYYLINLAGEVRRGMKEKATRGEAMGRPPFGYSVRNKIYVPDENADTVRYIFSQYAAGIGYRTISHDLADKGIRTKQGKVPNSTWIEYILHNPAYIGKIRWSEEGRSDYIHPSAANENVIISDGQHEALIDQETWDIVQRRLKAKCAEAKYLRKNGSSPFMLKGLVRCDNCGSTLTAVYNSRGKLSLQCCGYTRSECRVSHSILLEKANKTVVAALDDIVRSDAYVFTPSVPRSPAITHDWDKLIAAEEYKLERAKNALLEGVFEPVEYKKIKVGLEENIARMLNSKNVEESAGCDTVDISVYKQKALRVLEIIKSPDVNENAKNEELRSLIAKIIFKKPENTFDFYFAP